MTKHVIKIGLFLSMLPITAWSAEFSRIDLYNAFMNTAFGVEVQLRDSRKGVYIRKFNGDVKYHIEDEVGVSGIIQEYIDTIADIENISLKQARNWSSANFYIYVFKNENRKKMNRKILNDHQYAQFISEERLREYDNTACRYSIFPDPKGIDLSIVFISYTDEENLRYCLTEEILQAFGFTNDTNLVRHTVMNESRDSRSLSRFDLLLLSISYDQKVRPGMFADSFDFKQLIDAKEFGVPLLQPDLHSCDQDLNCRPSNTPSHVLWSQKRLEQLGLYAGSVDGWLGPETEEAAKAFQQSAGIESTGKLNQATLDAIFERTQ